MLRNIFPDEPGGDVLPEQTDNPGAFFAEFLPRNLAIARTTHNSQELSTDQQPELNTATRSSTAEAPAGSTDHQPKETQQQQRRRQQDRRDIQQAVADAAADAQASASQAAAAATAAADKAAQQAAEADLSAAAAAASSAHATHSRRALQLEGSSDGDFDLPGVTEIRSVLREAVFGSSMDESVGAAGGCVGVQQGADAGKHAAKKERQQPQEEEEEEEEGVLAKLLPFGRESTLRCKAGGLVASRSKPKPMRLKLAEQVLSKEMLAAVQLIETEILASADPLPSATLKYFLRTGRTMGQGWARQNLPRVFGFLSAYVAATCGVMHGVKAAAKWMAWRIPRVGRRVTGPAVSFTADVLLPTSFFGPFVATYVLVMIVCRQPKPTDEEGADADGKAAADGTATEQAAGHTHSRELQLEFLVESPPKQRRKRQLRHKQQQAKAKAHQLAAAAAAAEGVAAAGSPAAFGMRV